MHNEYCPELTFSLASIVPARYHFSLPPVLFFFFFLFLFLFFSSNYNPVGGSGGDGGGVFKLTKIDKRKIQLRELGKTRQNMNKSGPGEKKR